jgi:ribosomal protein S6--L-glutamate ligase
MILSFHPCIDADLQIILGDRHLSAKDLKMIFSADAVILHQGMVGPIFEACRSAGVKTFPDYKMRFKYPGKIGQSRLFRDFELPHPKTACWETVAAYLQANPEVKTLLQQRPFVMKANMSHEGEGVFLVKDEDSFHAGLHRLTLKERAGVKGFVVQEFIPCGGNVLRSVIMGKNIISYWKRPGRYGQEITTISKGALIDKTWQPWFLKMGKECGRLLTEKTGINLAAVDFLIPSSGKDPSPIFLEINYYFGRKGLGGMENYYRLLFQAVQEWLMDLNLDPGAVELV